MSQGAQAQYQVLFRHLFELELASRSLHATWRAYQATRALFRCAASQNCEIIAWEAVLAMCILLRHLFRSERASRPLHATWRLPGHARALSVGVVLGVQAYVWDCLLV